jgi:thioredoxin 1
MYFGWSIILVVVFLLPARIRGWGLGSNFTNEEKMSELVKIIGSEAEFESITKSGVVLVDFFATWCAPCRKQGAILDQVAEAVADKATIAKIDTDNLQSLAIKFGIEQIPTLILFKDGAVVERFTGVQQAAALQDTIVKTAS